MSWINDLDALASAGVLNYDAPAHIRGVQPRYVGNPPLEGITDKLPQMKQPPEKDEFTNNNIIKNPGWKKFLFATFALSGLAFGGYKLKHKIVPFVKNLFKQKKINVPQDIKVPFAPKYTTINPKTLKVKP